MADTTPTLREAAQQALEALAPLANATTPAEREALTDADAQAADAASCDLRAALAEQAVIPPAFAHAASQQMAVTSEWCRGWDACRAHILSAAPAAEQAEPVAPHLSYPHITQPYTLEEIRAQIASHDYSAELLLQHAMLLLDDAEQAEPVEVPAGYALVPVEPTEAMLSAIDMTHSCAPIDQWRAAIAAAPPAPARQEWQPIETAPRDGTPLLAYRERDGKIAVAYRVPRNDFEVWYFGGACAAERFFPGHRPSHWQPLPAAPITAAPAEGGA